MRQIAERHIPRARNAERGAFVLFLALFSIWPRVLEPILAPSVVLGSGFLVYIYAFHPS